MLPLTPNRIHKMTNKNWTIVLPLLMIFCMSGCGGDHKVTGKVTFPDNEPLTKGQVMFQKEGFIASGTIQKDGTYSAGKLKDGDGLPPGEYKVFLSEVTVLGERGPQKGVDPVTGIEIFEVAPTVSLVHPRFTSAGSSGLSVNVKGPTKYDIEVEYPQ
jgi:hypothetical protein